jgi:hypothetical protein
MGLVDAFNKKVGKVDRPMNGNFGGLGKVGNGYFFIRRRILKGGFDCFFALGRNQTASLRLFLNFSFKSEASHAD